MNKNFPDKFPIRYLIFIKRVSDKHDSDFSETREKLLWDELITTLQTSPLDINLLHLRFNEVGYQYNEEVLARFPKLNAPEDWCDNLAGAIKPFLSTGTLYRSEGYLCDLGLYSYSGMGEIPFFWQLYHHRQDSKKAGDELGLNFIGYLDYEKTAEEAYKIYQEIVTGNVEKWERYRASTTPKSFRLTIPYSPLWEALDRGDNNGMITPRTEEADITLPERTQKPSKKIEVVIVQDLESLFVEEVVALYKASSFCKAITKKFWRRFFGYSKEDGQQKHSLYPQPTPQKHPP